MTTAKQSDYMFNYLIIGNPGVGKSCPLIRFAEGTFSDNYFSTIGLDFRVKAIDIDSKSCKLKIKDTSGKETFRNVISPYYKEAQGIMLV